MKIVLQYIVIFVIASAMSSCATIIGGSKYWAKVEVPGHPEAQIRYNGEVIGTGDALIKVKRKDADKFSITIKEDGCEAETRNFNQKSIRDLAVVGTLVTWTGLRINGLWLPVPYGLIVDGVTGAVWKPDIKEQGVTKIDFKNFNYRVDYSGCNTKAASPDVQEKEPTSTTERLKELKKLFDEGVLTKEEFENEKKKILEE
jgi:hypothetical protein